MYIFYQNLIRDIPWSERNNSHTIEYSFYVISHQMIPLRFMTFFYRLTQQRVVIVPSILHQMKALLVHPRTLSCIVYNRRMIYRFFQLLPVRRFVEVIPMKKDIQNSITQVKNYFSVLAHMIDGILIGKMYLGSFFLAQLIIDSQILCSLQYSRFIISTPVQIYFFSAPYRQRS